ncbi:hypothetical protein AB0I93_14470 [Streptomyces sp. NPDC049967]|uniref:hypothetical protein n=1 Tax=Streptomyces sp. NPDC049967 TaxID=3155658 RepID=UPI003444847B
MPDRTPIPGPTRIYVQAIPGGAQLDMAALTEQVIGDVLDALLDPADTGLWDRLHDLADTPRTPAEGRLPHEELVAELVTRSSSRIPVYGGQVLRLIEALRRSVAPRPVPSQREAGAA